MCLKCLNYRYSLTRKELKMNTSSTTNFKNTHPAAFKQQKIMLEKLKMLPDYIETEIFHDWDTISNSISWTYTFQEESSSKWEQTVKNIIKKYAHST